jgi:hypothetical protein
MVKENSSLYKGKSRFTKILEKIDKYNVPYKRNVEKESNDRKHRGFSGTLMASGFYETHAEARYEAEKSRGG